MSDIVYQKGTLEFRIAYENEERANSFLKRYEEGEIQVRLSDSLTPLGMTELKVELDVDDIYMTIEFDKACTIVPGCKATLESPAEPSYIEDLTERNDVEIEIRRLLADLGDSDVELIYEDGSLEDEEAICERLEKEERAAYEAYCDSKYDEMRDSRFDFD